MQYEEPPEHLNSIVETAQRKHKDEEIVVLSMVIVHEITVGMEGLEGEVLRSINGQSVVNLKHVYEILTSPDLPEIVQLVFGDDYLCVFKKSQVQQNKARMLKRNKIPAETNLFDAKEEE